MTIDVIFCTESGSLESQAKMLVYSIRKFGGILKNASLFSYKPRAGKELAPSTISFFEDQNVHLVDDVLNKKFKDYPLANKPIVCAHHEKVSKADVIVFLDTDTFFINAPDFIKDVKPGEIFMRPVDVRNVGSDIEFKNIEGEYWKFLYDTFGVKNFRSVRSTLDQYQMLEYYNSGMIISHRSNSLFAHWKTNFEKVMNTDHRPSDGVFFVEQTVLSATVSAMELHVNHVPNAFNYPIHLIDIFKNPALKISDFNKLGHIHYHKIFEAPKPGNPLFWPFEKFDKGKEINKKLIEFGIVPAPFVPSKQGLLKRFFSLFH